MELLQYVFKTVLGMWNDDQIESFSHWVHYRGYFSFDDMYHHFHHNPDNIDKYDEYKVNGVKDHLNSNILHKIKTFFIWMSTEMKSGICILHDEFLISLTREQFIELRQGDIELVSNSRSSYATGHTKSTAFSESQEPLITSKGVKKGMHQPIPSRMIFKDHS